MKKSNVVWLVLSKNKRQQLWRIMKLTWILCVCFVCTLSANSLAQQKLSMNLGEASIKTVFEEIRKQTNKIVIYNDDRLELRKKVNADFKDMELADVLDRVLAGSGMTYKFVDDYIVITPAAAPVQDEKKALRVKGFVYDQNKEALPGVTVKVAGLPLGTSTDVKGWFTLELPEKTSLEFSFVGYKKKTVALTDQMLKDTLRVVMEEEVNEMEEVVVTGYQEIRKDRVTGSVTVITAKELENSAFKSIDQILEGKVAGLYSFKTSGAPGTRASVRIRGDNSISGNKEPLWVVDGLPLQGGVASINVLNAGNIQESALDHGIGNLSPADIESITILKDAAASAIYGARAANGVIVIKTKRGFEGDATFSYNGSFGMVSAPSIDLDFMNGREKVDFELELMRDFPRADQAGLAGKTYDEYMQGRISAEQYNSKLEKLRSTNTDWFDVIFRRAFSHSHFLSMRGGSAKTNYYASLNYSGQDGILKGNGYDNLGAKLEIRHKPIENLELHFQVEGSYRESVNHASAVDPFKYAVFANPYEKPYNEDGSYAADLSYLGNNWSSQKYGYKFDSFNILRELNETQDKSIASDISVRLGFNYKIMEGLTADVSGALTYSTNNTEKWAAPETYASYANASFVRAALMINPENEIPAGYNNGYLREGSGRSTAFALRGLLSYNNDKLEGHSFYAAVGSEIFGTKGYNNFHNFPEFNQIYRFTTFPSFDDPESQITYNRFKNVFLEMMGTGESQDRSASFFATFTYTLLDKYVFNVNARFDGADIIGTDNRFTPLWSASFRWNAMRENFLKNVNFISDLAVRLSYGYTGNIDRSSYPMPLVFLSSEKYDGLFIAERVEFPNPNIKWERKQDRNVGLDFGFWNNRIGGTFNYYWNTTRNLLGDMTTPASYGRESIRTNVSSLENTGWEFNINLRLDLGKEVSWVNSFNIAQNKNKITKTYIKNFEEFEAVNWRGSTSNIEGYATGTIFGHRFAGVNPATGNATFYLTERAREVWAKDKEVSIDQIPYVMEDVDGEFNQTVMAASLVNLGTVNPKVTGGFSSTLTWKQLEVRLGFAYSAGHLLETFNEREYAPRGGSSEIHVSRTNRLKSAANRWRTPGDITNTPRYSFTDHSYRQMFTDDKYEKADFLAFRDLSVSYDLRGDWFKYIGLSRCRVGLQVSNVFVFTKYSGLDVTTGGAFNYPMPRTYMFNLSLGF